MLCQDVEIRIHVEYCSTISNSYSSDKTVDELAHGMPLLAAGSIECRCSIVIYGLNW